MLKILLKKSVYRNENISNMLFDQKSPLYREAGFTNLDRKTHIHDTGIATYRLNRPMGHFSNKSVFENYLFTNGQTNKMFNSNSATQRNSAKN